MSDVKHYKKRKKQIKRMRKVHILPSIFIFLLFIGLFMSALSAFVVLCFEFMTGMKLDAVKVASNRVTSHMTIEENDGRVNVAFLGDTPKDFYVLDQKGKTVASSSGEDFQVRSYGFYDMEGNDVYFGGEFSSAFVKDRKISGPDLVEILGKYLADMVTATNIDSEFRQETTLTVPVWLQTPYDAGKYKFGYGSTISYTNNDLMFFLFLILFVAVFATIPMIFYLITLIHSYITQKKNADMVFRDPETGGRNWLFFSDKIGRKVRKKNADKKNYVLADVCFDKYASFCACYGIMEGELLLTQMYRAIRRQLSRKELVVRYVDGEFVICMVGVQPETAVKRINAMLEQLHKCGGDHKLEFTVGLCQVTKDTKDIDMLYRDVSAARRNIPEDAIERVAWFNESLKEAQLWEAKVEEMMESALANGEFQVYVQPKYTANTRVLGGAEALIRWISPTEGFIGPGRFIPIFEKNGFITKIDDFMIENVAKLQAQWIAEGKKVVPISVNVSRVHFTQEDLAEHICSIVEKAGAPKEYIELELTESAFFEDKNALIKTVKKLREMGFAVSMDDFGAGYSSLNSLKDLSLDVVKLDAEFFRGEAIENEKGSLIISETIKLAKGLGMKIVAEGIEEEPQVNFLADHECDLIQGFYFAKPMPAQEYAEGLDAQA